MRWDAPSFHLNWAWLVLGIVFLLFEECYDSGADPGVMLKLAVLARCGVGLKQIDADLAWMDASECPSSTPSTTCFQIRR